MTDDAQLFDDDPFALSTGLIEEYEGEVIDSLYTFDSAYNGGDTLVLKLQIKGLDEESLSTFKDGETTELYPAGSGWEAADQGRTAVYDGKDNKKFNKDSGVGLLVSHAMSTEAAPIIRERAGEAGAKDASIWTGLRFRFKRLTFGAGTDYERRRVLPVEFLGTADQPVTSTSSSGDSAPAAATPSAAPAPSAGFSFDGFDGALKGKIRAIAVQQGSADDFVAALFADDGLVAALTADQQAALMDPAAYTAIKAL